MYLEHYGLAEPPFSITPDPRFVFLSERHRDALAHLLFGVGQGGSGGFVQLTGEVGTGKTTLSRLLLEQLPDDTRVALVLNPRVSALELLETICEELHIEIDGAGQQDTASDRGDAPGVRRGSAKALVDALNAYLLDAYAKGLRVVVIIDEAQNLSVDALEQVRLLTNLETAQQKLLQILLLGQPELRTMLARDDLRQLSQRITARYHLMPLDADETAGYLRHRYRVAGGVRFPFTSSALRRLHQFSGGVPRLLNVIAERALLAGYARDAQVLDESIVTLAAREVLPPAPRAGLWAPPWIWLGAVAGLALLLAAWWWRPARMPAATAPIATAAPSKQSAAPTRARVMRASATDFNTLLQQAPAGAAPAWQRLLALWKLPTTAITLDANGACTPATMDVQCMRGPARIDKLLALDRPVLLPLRAGDGLRHALLLGADAMHVRLALGARVVDVERTTLQAAWPGQYLGLWRGPGTLATPMLRGQQGPAVDWLHARLGLARAPGTAFDRRTTDAVQRFQLARGLPADGVPGPETLMALASADAGPQLLRTLE